MPWILPKLFPQVLSSTRLGKFETRAIALNELSTRYIFGTEHSPELASFCACYYIVAYDSQSGAGALC
jgi:hypothetical protein